MCDSHYDNNDFLRREACSKCLYMCQNWETLEMSYSSYWSQLSWAPELGALRCPAVVCWSPLGEDPAPPPRKQPSRSAATATPQHGGRGGDFMKRWQGTPGENEGLSYIKCANTAQDYFHSFVPCWAGGTTAIMCTACSTMCLCSDC